MMPWNSKDNFYGYGIITLVADKTYCMEAKTMERTGNQPTFLDSLTSELGGPRTAQFFKKCDQLIPKLSPRQLKIRTIRYF